MVETYTQIFYINNDFLFYFPVNKDEQELPKRTNSSLVFSHLPHSSAQLCVDTYSKKRWAGKGPGVLTLGSESNAFESCWHSVLSCNRGQMGDNFIQRNCSVLIGVTLVLCFILTSSVSLVLELYTCGSNLSGYLNLDCLTFTLIS